MLSTEPPVTSAFPLYPSIFFEKIFAIPPARGK